MLIPYDILNHIMSEQENHSQSNSSNAAAEITDAMMSSLADVVKNVITPQDGTQTDVSIDDSVHVENNDVQTKNYDVNELILEGEAAHRSGDHKSALDSFNKAIAIDPSNSMAWFNRGVLLEAQQDMKGAKQSFVICLDLNSEHGPALANLAVLLDRLGDIDGAVEIAMRALDYFPGHPHLINIVEKNKAAGANVTSSPVVMPQTKEKLVDQKLTHAVEISDDHNTVDTVREPMTSKETVETIDVNEHKEEIQDFSEELSQEVDDLPIDLENLSTQAGDKLSQGDAKGALQILKEHLHSTAAQHFDSWRISAGAMAAMGLDDHAIGAYNHAISLNQDDSKCYFNLGALHERKGNADAASKCFVSALRIDPSYVKAGHRLLDLAEQTGNVEALLLARRSLVGEENGRELLATLLVELAEGEAKILDNMQGLPPTIPEGPELAKEAVELCGDNITLKGRALSASGQHTEAVKCWKKIIETDKTNPESWIGLARALEAAGDLNTAQKCHQKASLLKEQKTATRLPEQPTSANSELLEKTVPDVQNFENQIPVIQESAVGNNVTQVDYIETQPQDSPTTNEVNLAAAALEATAKMSNVSTMETNSSSVANQDIEWYNKGVGLIEDKKYREALSCFDRALPSFAGNDEMVIRILNGRGNALYYLEDYPKCVESYHKAMVINPKEVQGKTLYNMGTAYAEMQRFGDAIKCFEQAIPRGLSKEHQKLAKEQIRRCNILQKEQQRKLS